MVVSASAIGLGALLLFGIQPIVAKRLLPWFGGTAAVWTTCLVFFQGALLAGYLYAHALDRRLRPRAQGLLHAGALLLSLPALALLLAPRPALALDAHPMLGVLGILALTIGLPYVLLASTSPLLQAWLARRPGSDASVPALRAVEPRLARGARRLPGGHRAARALAPPGDRLGARLRRLRGALHGGRAPGARATEAGSPSAVPPDDGAEAAAPPHWIDRSLWTVLAACASLLLVAVTLHITQHVPAPLLWVVPLAAYLLTSCSASSGRASTGGRSGSASCRPPSSGWCTS